MNPKNFLFVFISVFYISGFSQETKEKEERKVNFKVGIFAGPNLSNLRSNQFIVPPEYKLGIDAGISFQYDFSRQLSMSFDLDYSIKGNKYTIVLTDNIGTIIGEGFYKLNTSYLKIPALFKYNFGKKVKLSPMLGPYIGLLFGAKEINDLGTTNIVNELDVGEDLLPIDFGLTGGLGIEIPIKNAELSYELRYNMGLIEVYSNPSFIDAYNSSFCLLFGLKFNLGNGFSP